MVLSTIMCEDGRTFRRRICVMMLHWVDTPIFVVFVLFAMENDAESSAARVETTSEEVLKSWHPGE
jgi:hypothetical protein